jgi:hypothetical protein
MLADFPLLIEQEVSQAHLRGARPEGKDERIDPPVS